MPHGAGVRVEGVAARECLCREQGCEGGSRGEGMSRGEGGSVEGANGLAVGGKVRPEGVMMVCPRVLALGAREGRRVKMSGGCYERMVPMGWRWEAR